MVMANKVVQSEYLKTVSTLVKVDLLLYRRKGHVSYLLYLSPNLGYFLFTHITGKRFEGKLMTILKLTVVFSIFLNCIIGQMNEVVLNVVG